MGDDPNGWKPKFRNYSITFNTNRSPFEGNDIQQATAAFEVGMQYLSDNIKDYIIERRSSASDPAVPYPHKEHITVNKSKWSFETGDKYGKLHVHWGLYFTVDGPPPDPGDAKTKSAMLDYKKMKKDLEEIMQLKGFGFRAKVLSGLIPEQEKIYREKEAARGALARGGVPKGRARGRPRGRGRGQ